MRVCIILYLTYAVIFGAILDLMIAHFESVDDDFAESMSNKSARTVTIFIMAIFWVIFMPKFVYNLIRDCIGGKD